VHSGTATYLSVSQLEDVHTHVRTSSMLRQTVASESASQLRRMKVCVVSTQCDSWEIVKGISYVGVEIEIVCVFLCVRMLV
jgi:hypothetical protein